MAPRKASAKASNVKKPGTSGSDKYSANSLCFSP